jgi:hypothetical protein
MDEKNIVAMISLSIYSYTYTYIMEYYLALKTSVSE